MADPSSYDCAVIGAGPGGLTAALYLRRFHRRIIVLDAGESRARWIPESHNCPGFPSGVSGDALLAKLYEQAARYDVVVTRARVVQLEDAPTGFRVAVESGRSWAARTALLATGVTDVLPDEPWVARAIEAGAMRLCAICDAYEASDGDLAVYGPARTAIQHARFLRTFSQSVTVVVTDPNRLDEQERSAASDAGINILDREGKLIFDGSKCGVIDADGRERHFDALYPVLGSRAQSGLATALGARVDDNDELFVASDQMTSVEGLYAIGDVVSALNQIAVATGHAAIAATAIHNALPANFR